MSLNRPISWFLLIHNEMMFSLRGLSYVIIDWPTPPPGWETTDLRNADARSKLLLFLGRLDQTHSCQTAVVCAFGILRSLSILEVRDPGDKIALIIALAAYICASCRFSNARALCWLMMRIVNIWLRISPYRCWRSMKHPVFESHTSLAM